jgi:hypothetical protein
MNTPPRTAFAGSGPIIFQGIHLPHYAKYFYICTLRQLIPDVVYEWTLDLRIVGQDSDRVLVPLS